MIVYILQRLHGYEHGGTELIGIFSERSKAVDCMELDKPEPQFGHVILQWPLDGNVLSLSSMGEV